MYEYKATILDIIDGDTVDCRVDLGFHFSTEDRYRFSLINAPEVNSKDPEVRARAKQAEARVRELMPPGTVVLLRTTKDSKGRDSKEKYGRYLGHFYLLDDKLTDVNQLLLDEGLAVSYKK